MSHYQAACKRTLDLLLAVAGIVFLLPVLFGIALAVLILDGRPIVYTERRIGCRRRLFRIYKYRTLKPSGPPTSVATGDDPRLTTTGGFLRRWHLDELLQLANIIRGDMSLVGPRPIKPAHAATLAEETLDYLLSVRPGLTGPASLKYLAEDEALAGYSNAEVLYLNHVLPAKVRCDLEYVQRYSLTLDLTLIAQTLFSVFSARARASSIRRVSALLPPRIQVLS